MRRETEEAIDFREARASDVAGISRVRTSVTENTLTLEQLAERGVTNESVAASFAADAKGWVAVNRDEIVGFSIADRGTRSIFALFVLPAYENRGIGSRLFDLAVEWLWDTGATKIWLTTAAGTKAARFYEKRGWVPAGHGTYGDVRYECDRPDNPAVAPASPSAAQRGP